MAGMSSLALPLLLLSAAAGTPADPADPPGVTVYRCTDARGKVELRDTPCGKAQHQQQRQMVRPKDAPPAPARPAPAASPAPVAAPPPQVIVINTPRPMYECVTPDGTRYTSETAEGNPRWMPLWAQGYPVLAEGPVGYSGGGSVRYRDRHSDIRYDSGGGVRYGVVPTIAAYGAGTWVRDACQALPQQEMCARLRDRRGKIGREFFNAQPSERERLGAEERSLDARLSSDCGGR